MIRCCGERCCGRGWGFLLLRNPWLSFAYLLLVAGLCKSPTRYPCPVRKNTTGSRAGATFVCLLLAAACRSATSDPALEKAIILPAHVEKAIATEERLATSY